MIYQGLGFQISFACTTDLVAVLQAKAYKLPSKQAWLIYSIQFLTSGVETEKYNPSCPLLYPVSHPDMMPGEEQVLMLLNAAERELTRWKRCWKQYEINLCHLNFS